MFAAAAVWYAALAALWLGRWAVSATLWAYHALRSGNR